jgi:hypothetical protein
MSFTSRVLEIKVHRLAKNFTLILLISLPCLALPALAENTTSQASINLAQQMYVAYYGRPVDSLEVV